MKFYYLIFIFLTSAAVWKIGLSLAIEGETEHSNIVKRAAQFPGSPPQDHKNTGNTYLNQTSNVGEGRNDGLLPRGMSART
ncbi:hypothetical protein ACKWTF_002580 [Chironomus riparius]